jgi:putative ABC transport system permease protein
MSVIWKKVWSDLWRHKVRTLLAVLSISAGVFAIGVMFGLSDQLITTMDQSHKEAVAPHINIALSRYIDRDMVMNIQHLPGVEGVQPYNEIIARYKVSPEAEWKQGVVYMLDDYDRQKYELVTLREGEWPQRNHIDIERMAAQYLGLGVGDSVIFKINDMERTYAISGLVRHPFVPPPQFQDLMFFFADAQGMERFGVPVGQFASLFVRVTPYSLEHAKEVATEIKDFLGKQNIGIGSTVYQDPDRHWGRSMMDGMSLVMNVLAILSLAMSVVIVYNTINALIAHETEQIGIMKAIGGQTLTIVRIYLCGALAYGLLALVLAVPLGTIVAFLISQTFLNLFNIDYNTFQVSYGTLAFQVVAALAVPLAAGAIPVVQGASVTVRQAIASYGLDGTSQTSRMDQVMQYLGRSWMPTRWASVIGNMFRRKRRLALTQVALVTAGVMFLMVMSLSSSIDSTLQQIFSRQRYDITLQFGTPQRTPRMEELVKSVPGVEAVESRFIQNVTLLTKGQLVKEAGIGSSVEGVPEGSDFYIPMVVAGRWLAPGDGQVAVLPVESARKNKIAVGDTVILNMGELGKSEWVVVGLYDPVFSGGFYPDTIYAPASALFESTKVNHMGTLVYARTRHTDVASVNATTAALKDMLEQRNIPPSVSQTKHELQDQLSWQFGISTNMLMALAIIIAMVGGIALMGALSISVVERTKEIGVLRAIGARSRTILGMFLLEGILQGVLSWMIAIPIAFVFAQPFADGMGRAMFSAALSYQFNGQAVFVWLVLLLMISGAASIMPARNAAQVRVRDSLAYA